MNSSPLRPNRPDWLADGLVFVGHWEPLIFRRRRGGQRTDEAERYAREHSDEALRALTAAGCNLVVTHFDKGFGLAAHAEDLPLLHDWIRRLHAAGIRVGVYIRYDTLVTETLPQASEWASRTSFGDSSIVLGQGYRRSACPTHPGHLAHIKGLIESAIEDFGVDLIHLDGFWMGHESWACHCDRCLAAFTSHLQTRYPTSARAIERFGHDRLETIRPPVYRQPDMSLEMMESVKDPAAQEWLAWRTGRLTAITAELGAFIRAQNDSVAFEVNTLIPIGYNNAFYWGFELPEFAPHVDALWTEDDHWAGWRSDGVLVSRLREFKIGRTLNTRVFSYQRGSTEKELRLSLLQGAAFNRGDVGMLGSPLLAEEPLYNVKRDFMTWFQRHRDRFTRVSSAAEVALWRSQASLAHNSTSVHRGVILAEQTLIQGQIPFDIVYDDALADLSRYKVVVAPHAEMLSEVQIEALAAYVRAGGGLVATGRAGLFDPWRRVRPDLGLREVLGPDARLDLGDFWRQPGVSLAGNQPFSRHDFGAGRAAYLPKLRTRRAPDYSGVIGEEPYRFGTEQWEMPLNAADLLAAVRWAAGDGLGVEVEAPEGVAVEALRGADGALRIHLLNYNVDSPAQDIIVRVRHAVGPRGSQVLALGYGEAEPRLLDGHVNAEVLTVVVSVVDPYQLLIIT